MLGAQNPQGPKGAHFGAAGLDVPDLDQLVFRPTGNPLPIRRKRHRQYLVRVSLCLALRVDDKFFREPAPAKANPFMLLRADAAADTGVPQRAHLRHQDESGHKISRSFCLA